MSEPSQAERISMVKFARCSALAADKLCASLVALTEKMEQQKLIDPNRQSKIDRDRKLARNAMELKKSDEAIEKLIKDLAENNPDTEKLVSLLFTDKQPGKTKKNDK